MIRLGTPAMWRSGHQDVELRWLLARIEAASEPTRKILESLLRHACPRLDGCRKPVEYVRRLIEAEAWVDFSLYLVACELPDWVVHSLACDESRWRCSICVRGLAINWTEEIAEFDHDNLPMAILGAFVLAQLGKLEGRAASNVIPFRRLQQADKDQPHPGERT